MASLRAELMEVMKVGSLEKQLREAMTIVDRLVVEKKRCAIAYNFTADLFMEQSLVLEDPVQSRQSIRDGLNYYEQAAELAPHCVETVASYGGALIALKLYDLAAIVLQKGIAIKDGDCAHPFINHIGVTPGAGTKDQLIARARVRIKKDLAYMKACREGSHLGKVLKQLENPRAQVSTVVNAAKKVADEKHDDARAKLLYPHVVLRLLKTGQLLSDQISDQTRESILQSALSHVIDLSAQFPKSLVISLCLTKLQMSLGFVDRAEKEYCRALGIVNPDDPRDHEIPFGFTKGVKYIDRVVYTTLEVICGLNSVVNMVESHFSYLNEESNGSLLSIKVDKMLKCCENDLEMTCAIHEAIDYYKMNKSWVSWRCPWKDDLCVNFAASTQEELLLHVFQHANVEDNAALCDAVLERLSLFKYTSHEDPHFCLYLSKDDEGHDVFCMEGLDYLFKEIVDVLTGNIMKSTPPNSRLGSYVDQLPVPDREDAKAFHVVEKIRKIAGVLSGRKLETISPDSTFASFVNHLSTLDLENTKAFDILENLWTRLLKSLSMDQLGKLMVLIATIKWSEMKDILENQIAETKITDLDTSPENETLLQISEMKGDTQGLEKGVVASKSCYHAFKYGHDALHRRIKTLSALADKNKMAQKEDRFDPYVSKIAQKQFVKELIHVPPHLVRCSACYFERATSRSFRHREFLYHFSQLHGPGVNCTICAVRFVTASALTYHMNYIHNVNLANEQVSGPD